MEKILPNTTQVPNIIFDEWLPNLKDVELRVLLIVVRQTLGWIEDKETGRRKEKDWISRWQLMKKTGRGHSSVSVAVEKLSKMGAIEAYDINGVLLSTPKQRSGNKIFYRLKLDSPQLSLFDRKKKPVQKVDRPKKPVQNMDVQKLATTKETGYTKLNNSQTARLSAVDNFKKPFKNKTKIKQKPAKPASTHKQLVDFWHEHVQRARGIKNPIITKADCKNLKRVLDLGIGQIFLEQAAIYFLYHYTFRQFSPSVSTFLSAGILNGLMNRMENQPDFWKELDELTCCYLPRVTHINPRKNANDMVETLARLTTELTDTLSVKMTPGERTAMQERHARLERASKL